MKRLTLRQEVALEMLKVIMAKQPVKATYGYDFDKVSVEEYDLHEKACVAGAFSLADAFLKVKK